MAENDEKILQALEALQADVSTIKQDVGVVKQGQRNVEQGQVHTNTAVEALAAGQQDLRKHMATKQDVEAIVAEVRAELRTDILTIDKKLVRKVQSHENRIDQLERERGLQNPDKH